MGYIREDELIQFPNQDNGTPAMPGSYTVSLEHDHTPYSLIDENMPLSKWIYRIFTIEVFSNL